MATEARSKSKPVSFPSVTALKKWLNQSKLGQSLLVESLQSDWLATYFRTQDGQEWLDVNVRKIPVLVVVDSDFVEVYGPRNVSAKIVRRVYAMDSPELERLAEEYLMLCIPRSHRDVYLPGFQRAAESNQLVTLRDESSRIFHAEAIRLMDKHCGQNAKET